MGSRPRASQWPCTINSDFRMVLWMMKGPVSLGSCAGIQVQPDRACALAPLAAFRPSPSDTAVGGAAHQVRGFRALLDGKHGAEGVPLNKEASEGARDGPKGAHPMNCHLEPKAHASVGALCHTDCTRLSRLGRVGSRVSRAAGQVPASGPSDER